MKLLVSARILQEAFGLEAPIKRIDVVAQDDSGIIFGFVFGEDDGRDALLTGMAEEHTCPEDHSRWMRWNYHVLQEA